MSKSDSSSVNSVEEEPVRKVKHSSDSESVSTSDNIEELKLRNIDRINKNKPKDFSSEIDKDIRFKAFEYLNNKNIDYIYSKMNGIHRLIYKWELENNSKILPATDLKQLILLILNRENEIIENVIDFKYSNDVIETCCGCLITKDNNIPDFYKKIDRISIKNNDKYLNFKLAYTNEYNYITDILGVNPDYVIYIP